MAQETQTGACIDLERWDGEGDGREVQKGGDIFIPMADSASLVAQTVKVSAYNVGDHVRPLGQADPPGEGNGNPLQYSCLENSMD